MSHPTWVRGLKPRANVNWQQAYPVAPYVGAWIETTFHASKRANDACRTLRGCVD